MVARADDAPAPGETVVGEFVQVWQEHENPEEAAERGDESLLSFVRTGSGDSVRLDTEDVENLPLGATVELTVGATVADAPATEDGLDEAREVLAAEVLQTEPVPTAPAEIFLDHEVTVVMVTPAGGVQDGTTLQQVVDAVNGPVSEFWWEEAHRRVGVVASHDWMTTSADCSDPYALWDEVALEVGFVKTHRAHLLLYVTSAPAELDCAYGLAEVSPTPVDGGYAYVRDTETSVIAHELGHNFSLQHSSARQCDRAIETGICETVPYADYYDVMGYSWGPIGSLNLAQASALNLLLPHHMTEIHPESPPTTVTLVPVSQQTGMRGIQLWGGPGSVYWLEYRPASGRDSWLGTADNPGLQAGVQLRHIPGSGSDRSLLLDGTPSAPAGWEADIHTALPVGTPIRLAGGDFTVTVQAVSASAATIRVETAAFVGDVRCEGRLRPTAPLSGVALLTKAGGTTALGVGTDRALWARPVDGNAASWHSLGGGLVHGPAATTAGATSYVFAVGTDRALWYRAQSGTGWTPWRTLGGQLVGSPAAASLGAGHVRVVGRGADGSMWSRELTDGAWSAWTGHGGVLSSPPTATADPDSGAVEISVRGGDGHLFTMSLAIGVRTGTFQRQPQATCSALAMAASRTANDPALGAYLDGGNAPHLLLPQGSRSVEGTLTSTPAVHFAGNDVVIAGRGGDGALWLYDGRSGRNRWVPLGGRIA